MLLPVLVVDGIQGRLLDGVGHQGDLLGRLPGALALQGLIEHDGRAECEQGRAEIMA